MLADAVEGIARALEPLELSVPGLQIDQRLNPNPTPPSIDVYPGDPFQEGLDMRGGVRAFFTVRVRVGLADQQAANDLLLAMLEPHGPTSVRAALEADQTLGGMVDTSQVAAEGVSGFRVYPSAGGGDGSLLGAEWRLEVLL